MLECTHCKTRLPARALNTGSLAACPGCGVLLRADVFPALAKPLDRGARGEALQLERQAACFYHPRKKAVVPCDVCGRFLCALCDVCLDGRHLCPTCLEKGKTGKQKIQNLEDQRTCYDSLALIAATVPMLIYWLTIFTAPLALYLTVRYWRSPSSITGRTKIRFILAAVIAGVQMGGWFVFFFKLFGRMAT